MDNVSHVMPEPPQGSFRSLAWLLCATFFIVMSLALLDMDGMNTASIAMPIVFVGALWSVPLVYALAKGNRVAFIIYIALFVFLTESNFRVRDWTDKSWDWQVLLKGLIWMGAGAAGLFQMRRVVPVLSKAPAFWGLLFVLLIVSSAAWSPTKMFTLQAGMAYLWFLIFGITCATCLKEKDIHLGLLLGTIMIVLPSLAVAPFGTSFAGVSPGSTGEIDRLRGMTEHPIPLAENASLCIFLAVLWASRYRSGRWLIILLVLPAAAAVTLLTQSRLPPLAMFAAVSFAFAYKKGGLPLLLPVFVGVALLFAIEASVGLLSIIPGDILQSLSRSGSGGEITTLSGRTEIWPFVIDKIKQSWLIGHGHASGPFVLKDFYRWKINHAHNLFLQTLLYLGVIGFFVLIMAFWNQLKVFFLAPNMFRDSLVIFQIIKGFTEQSVIANMPSSGFLCWSVTLGLSTLAIFEARRQAHERRRIAAEQLEERVRAARPIGRGRSPNGPKALPAE